MAKDSTKYYGGFWLRAAASIIDTLIMWVVGLGINAALGIKTLPAGETTPQISSDSIFAFLFSIIATSIYYSFVQGHFQGTIGKHIMGLKLVDAKTYKKISIGQSTGRYCMSYISALCLGIGYLTVGQNKKKQSWHDRAAGTIVVKKQYLGQLQELRRKRIEEAKRARANGHSLAA